MRSQPRPTQAAAAPALLHRFAFAGTAREYLGIWTVNILLTVLTLGIYAPWALVRARRYFHGNTLLEGVAFGYHARPTQILKGRLIAVAAFAAYVLTAAFYPWFELVGALVILPVVVPWIVVRALRFRRRVASHRHLRFGFTGTMREAFEVYVVLMATAILTAGALYPHALYRRRRYLVEHSWFGRTNFRFDGSSSGFYSPFARVVGVAAAFAAIVAGIVFASGIDPSPVLTDDATEPVRAVVSLTALAAGLLLAYSYVSTRIENYAWNHTLLGADRFAMDLEFGRMLWLYLSNLLAVVASVGLMIPWAQVRLARYRLSRLCLQTVAGLDAPRRGRARDGLGDRPGAGCHVRCGHRTVSGLRGFYFDGRTSAASRVEIRIAAGTIVVQGDGVERAWPLAGVRVAPRIGNAARTIDFTTVLLARCATTTRWIGCCRRRRRADGCKATSPAREPPEVRGGGGGARAARGLDEHRVRRPLARPGDRPCAAARRRRGHSAREPWRAMDQLFFERSQVDRALRPRLRAQFAELARAAMVDGQARLEFRASPYFGPNVFALPYEIVVLTDELVASAASEEELVAVLAHELGHIRHRHALRGVLQNSITPGCSPRSPAT